MFFFLEKGLKADADELKIFNYTKSIGITLFDENIVILLQSPAHTCETTRLTT
jgi:hypothetical protein